MVVVFIFINCHNHDYIIRIEFYQPCDARSIGGGGRGRRAPQVGELHDGEQGELA